MKKLIVIIGARRSGLHAVCNWMIGHFSGRVRFVDDPPVMLPPQLDNFVICFDYQVGAENIRLIPTLHLLQVHARLLNGKVAGTLPWLPRKVAGRLLARFWDERLMRTTCPLPEIDADEAAAPDAHIILIQNLTPAAAAQVLPAWLAAYRIQFGLPPVDRETLTIVVRSPWNCLASTLKHHALGSGARARLKEWLGRFTGRRKFSPDGDRFVPPPQIGELWSAYAREILGETRHLDPAQWQVQPLVYDDWIIQPELRASLADQLGRPPDDRGLARTAIYGGGSSFDGQQRVASSPGDLTNRWRLFEQHRDLRALLASAEIRRLATALGMTVPSAG